MIKTSKVQDRRTLRFGRMRELLGAIRDGSFARDLKRDHEAGAPWMRAQREAAGALALEPAGAAVRKLMPWLGASGARKVTT